MRADDTPVSNYRVLNQVLRPLPEEPNFSEAHESLRGPDAQRYTKRRK
jgi:hypothetical protein